MILLHRLYAQRFKQLEEVTLFFPDRGSVLIEGSNEAGKSSLFEAVYFALYGQTLLAERDYTIEQLRQYGAEEMTVELEFSIDDRPFSILRRLSGKHRARLICPAAGGQTETITTLNEITRRLQSELHLTPDGLLNTCFVEQKRLERLEDLKPVERQKAVNDLLNLRILTGLEETFKIKKEDQLQVQELGQRLKVAQLDALLPALEREVTEAALGLSYAQAEGAAGRLQQIAAALEAANSERARVCALLDAAQSRLRRSEQLRDLITALDRIVSPAIEAWETALRLRQEGARRVQDLEALAADLPEREQALAIAARLLSELESLERLQNAATGIESDLTAGRNRLAEYDRLAQDWRAGDERRVELEASRALQHAAQRECEETARQRGKDRQRDGRLALLAGHDRARRQALDEAKSIAAQLEQASDLRNSIPALEKRQQELSRLEELLRGRDEMARALHRAGADLATAREQLEKDRRDQEEALLLDERLERLAGEIAAGRAAEQAAAEEARQGSLHQALVDWVEAAGRLGEESRVEARAVQLSSRRQAALDRQTAADQELRRATRKQTPGFVLGIGAIVLAIAGAAAGHWILFGLIGAVILIPAAILVILARSGAAAARQAVSAARTEADALDGETRATRLQHEEAAAQRARWTEREAASRQAIQAISGPTARLDLDEARERIAAPPVVLSAAQDRHAAARDALNDLNNQETLARARRESLVLNADPDSLARRVEDLLAEKKRLEREASESSLIPALLNSLQVSADAVPNAAIETGDALARVRAAADSIPALERQAASRQAQSQHETAEMTTLARELGLPGDQPGEWAAAAAEIRAAFAAALEMVTDDSLRETVDAARAALSDTDRALAALGADQTRRRNNLDSTPREALASAVEAQETAIAANRSEQALLTPVLPALQSAGLPVESGPLRTELEIRRAALRGDRNQSDRLPEAHATLERLEADLQSKQEVALARWNEALPGESLPETAVAGQDRLPPLRAAAAAERDQLDEAAIQAEINELQQTVNAISRQIHNLEHDSGRALSEREALREDLRRELQVDPGEEWESLPAALPELARVKAQVAARPDPSEWQETLRQRREAHTNNRTRRTTLAQQFDIEADPLDLPVEQEAFAAAEQALLVKKRAGEIVDKTRESIVNRVMPLTIQNMRQLLPLLTEGRYQEAEWDEATDTISIYDNLARSYQRKRVFSGGARDQISLSLRLAFALATLPGEHNCRPGFLFLDEPLSSFDRPRTRALVDLLTRGILSREFAQILLISHSESFNPDQFDHRIRMDGGRVVESTLGGRTGDGGKPTAEARRAAENRRGKAKALNHGGHGAHGETSGL